MKRFRSDGIQYYKHFTKLMKKTGINYFMVKQKMMLLGVACLMSAASYADQTVTFYNVCYVNQGEILTFNYDYVDNTKTAFMSDILEPVQSNAKQFRFKGTSGYYCFQSFDVNPFLRGACLGWGSPKNNQYEDWKGSNLVNNNTEYNSHRFLAPVYPMENRTNTGANGYEYIYVMPVDDSKNGHGRLGNDVDFASDDLSWFRDTNGANFGYGHIWLVGSNDFGFPSVWAWKGDRCFKGWTYGDARDNFVPMTQTQRNKNVITIRTGQHLNTKSSNFAFKFFVSAMAWDGNGAQYSDGGFEGNTSTTAWFKWQGLSTTQNTSIDFLNLEQGGNISGVIKNDNEKNEAEKNSALPQLPLNYDLQFIVDLTNVTLSSDHASLPLELNIVNRPLLAENSNVASSCEVFLSGSLIDIEDNPLWSNDGVNNYTLADALRFQAGLLYAEQVNTNFNKMKISGSLTASDLNYLQYLLNNGKIKQLDLSDARLPELKIPDNFVANQGLTSLEAIVLPHYLNVIGSNAFANCSSLSSVTFTGTDTGGCTIASGAFKNCTSLTAASIEQILKTTPEVQESVFEGSLQANSSYEITIPSNISAIGDNAFKDCNITKVNVPAKYEAPTATAFSEDRVGVAFRDVNLPVVVGTDHRAIIEAEDFNSGISGSAYLFNHNSNLAQYYPYRSDVEGAPVWKVGKPSTDYHNCQSPEGEADKHLVIGDIEAGDWMNYTVNVPEKGGSYFFVFNVANSGGEGAFSVYVDGVKMISHENIGGDYDNCNESRTMSDIKLSKGKHVIQFYCDNKLNFDYFTVQRLYDWTDEDSDDSQAASEYDGLIPNVSASAFTTDPNHLEIAFAPVADYASETERLQYIHEQYKGNDHGWKRLITKHLYENNSNSPVEARNFDVCNQELADVQLHRNFGNETNWETLVLPFDVYAGQDNVASSYNNPATVNTTENKIKHAAVYIGTAGDKLRFLNVGTHNADDDDYGSSDYMISAGTPFIVYLNKDQDLSTDAVNGDYVTFVDVDLKSNATPKNILIGDYWFCGTFNAIEKHDVPEGGLWAFSGDKIMHATKTAKFKGYRCWFQTAESATSESELFPYNVVTNNAATRELLFETVEQSYDSSDHPGDTTEEPLLVNGINNVRIETTNEIFTLTGLRTTSPQKGIYIVNGKKMMIK